MQRWDLDLEARKKGPDDINEQQKGDDAVDGECTPVFVVILDNGKASSRTRWKAGDHQAKSTSSHRAAYRLVQGVSTICSAAVRA